MHRTKVIVAANAALALWLIAVPALAALMPTALKVTRRNELEGTGNADYFAWTRDDPGSPRGFHVWVQPTGGAPYEVNPRGTNFVGQIDQTGSRLVYDQFPHGGGDIKLYDMASKTQVALPAGIDTAKPEFEAAVFGNQLTFIRAGRTETTLWLVTDLSTGAKIAVKVIDPSTTFFANPPHLYGNWLTYATCNRKTCAAFRYDIGGMSTLKIPNPRHLLYFAPSSDLAGNVYFERSRFGCGRAARMMKWIGSGDPTVFYSFAPGTDMTGSSVFDDGAGNVTVYVDFFDCATNGGDIYSFANP